MERQICTTSGALRAVHLDWDVQYSIAVYVNVSSLAYLGVRTEGTRMVMIGIVCRTR